MLLSEPQRNKDTVRCAMLGAEVQGQCQEHLIQTLIVCLWKKTCLIYDRQIRGALTLMLPSLSNPLNGSPLFRDDTVFVHGLN